MLTVTTVLPPVTWSDTGQDNEVIIQFCSTAVALVSLSRKREAWLRRPMHAALLRYDFIIIVRRAPLSVTRDFTPIYSND